MNLRLFMLTLSMSFYYSFTNAQFIGTDPSTAPTLDGAVGAGEYGAYSGAGTDNWQMCWDDTYLYIAKTSFGSGQPAVVALDIDPISTSTDYVSGGTDADGNLFSQNHFDHTIRSPFRTDISIYFTESYVEYWERDGTGGWSQQLESSPILTDGSSASALEVRIRWSDLVGISGRPAAFNWYAYHFDQNGGGAGNDFVYHQTPSSNASGAVNGTNFYFNFYYSVTNTTNSSTTDPFSQTSFEWRDAFDYTFSASTTFYDLTNNSSNVIILENNSTTETIQVDNNLKTGNGLRMNSDETLQMNAGSTLIINNGGFVDINGGSLNYNSNSTLVYNTGTTYGRFDEWSATTGSGYPGNVTIANNTALNLGNSGTGTARQIAGNLSIESGSSLSTNETGSKMTAALTILGDVTNNGTLTLSDQAGADLNVGGNWQDNGTFAQNEKTVTLNGSSTQDISGTTAAFSQLTINNSNGVTVSSSTDITSLLTLTSGTLTSGGNLNLKSTSTAAGGTAVVDFSGGSVSGNVVVERFLDGAAQEGYRYVATNVSAQTYAAINDDISLNHLGAVFSPGTNVATYDQNEYTPPLPNVFYYDQSLVMSGTIGMGDLNGQSFDQAVHGWEIPASTATAFNPGTGVALQVGASDLTLDFTGTLQTNDVVLSLAHGGQTNSGWHLIGNPFAATLDWNQVYDDGGNSGVEPIAYVFDASSAYAGSYSGYNAATDMAVNSGTENIASGQAFFIQTTSGMTGDVTLKTSHTTTTDAAFFRTQRDAPELFGELRLLLTDEQGRSDELLIYQIEEAHDGKDLGDAKKFFSGAYGLPLISSRAYTDLMMDCRKPLSDEDQTYELKIKSGMAGNYSLKASTIAHFPEGVDIYLEDQLTNTLVKLNDVDTYTFSIDQNDYTIEERFLVHLRVNRVTALASDWENAGLTVWSSLQQLNFKFESIDAAASKLSVYDLTGRVLWRKDNREAKALEFGVSSNIKQQVVLVKVENKQGLYVKKIYID